MRILSLLAAISCLAVPTLGQSDYWIDPVLGSNQSIGSEAAPFRTITKGLDEALPGTTLHLRPGTYSLASGEAFPLRVDAGVSVTSVSGKEFTTIHGDVGAPAGRLAWLSPGARLSGVTLTSSGSPIVGGVPSQSSPRSEVRDCDFVGGQSAMSSGYTDVVSCRFLHQSASAIRFFEGDFRMEDCEIIGRPNSRGILGVYFHYDSIQSSLELTRCTITQCGAGAVHVLNSASPSTTTIHVADSLIASNPGGGIMLDGAAGWQSGSIVIDGCTIVNNGHSGATNASQNPNLLTVRSSIVWGHDAADVNMYATVETSLTGDGSGGVASGNLEGDPRFVDAASGDWTLRFDSPCLDRGDPAAIRIDRAGRLRVIDSDLNLVPRPDMGAFEHVTLEGPTVATIGDSFTLGVTGPNGGFSTIIVAPGGYAPFGAPTLYGRLFTAPQGSFRLMPALTTGGGPTMVDVASSLDPAWIGTTIGLQALTRSTSAPAGAALTNPMLVQVN